MSPLAVCLWFDGKAEEAANHYVSTFLEGGHEASLGAVVRYGEAGPGKAGTVLVVEFSLDGQDVMGVNGGPNFTFSPAVSMVVKCANQAEIDRFWDRLSDGGAPGRCGWLADRFGVSWQIVPAALGDMMHDPDPTRRNRVMRALLRMDKLEVATLQAAFDGKAAA